jgi:hypothetical protein
MPWDRGVDWLIGGPVASALVRRGKSSDGAWVIYHFTIENHEGPRSVIATSDQAAGWQRNGGSSLWRTAEPRRWPLPVYRIITMTPGETFPDR